MTPLPRVTAALERALPDLPPNVDRVAYTIDVDATGADSLVVYFLLRGEIPTAQKRELEERLRYELRTAGDRAVYFRWRTADEHQRVVTKAGLIDRPVSVARP